MILCQVYRDKDRAVRGFKVSGHALFEDVGKDIVCAAVAALSQTAVIGLEEYIGMNPRVTIQSGLLECHLSGAYDGVGLAQAQAVLETMVLGLHNIAESYPQNVRVEELDLGSKQE
jgi:hypothetical protein